MFKNKCSVLFMFVIDCSDLFYCSVLLFCSVLISCSVLICCSVVMFCSVLFCSVLFCSILEVNLTYLMKQISNACNIKIDENNYLKDRTVCKSCYNNNRRNNKNNNTLIQKQHPKIDNTIHKNPITKNTLENKTCHKHLIVGSSGYGKSYPMNYILLKKQGSILLNTKSQNQYPKIKAQISDQSQPLENYKNSTVVFDDMLLSKQESNFDLFFA